MINNKFIVVLIPSFNPDINMVNYVKELINSSVKNIVIVDDGSDLNCSTYFDDVKDFDEVTLLKHDENKGKGRALKTGIEYILNNMKDVVGIVTADADGQHSCKDTIKVANRLYETNEIVFGTRNFNEDIVPFKSRNGNKITTLIFQLLYGLKVNDTQTGLRGLPIEFAKKCLDIEGERYEYEIGMLIKAVKDHHKIIEEPIDTIYINSNRSSHFNAFKDSYKIYKIMFSEYGKYCFSSLLSTVIDFILYSFLIKGPFNLNYVTNGILYSTAIARVVSSIVNYLFNKNKVFKSNKDSKKTFIEYCVVAIVQMFASSLLVTLIYSLTHIESIVIKVIVDTALFFVNYQVQRLIFE